MQSCPEAQISETQTSPHALFVMGLYSHGHTDRQATAKQAVLMSQWRGETYCSLFSYPARRITMVGPGPSRPIQMYKVASGKDVPGFIHQQRKAICVSVT